MPKPNPIAKKVVLLFLLTVCLVRLTFSQVEAAVKYPEMPGSIMEAELTDIDGRPFHLSDFKGKVFLLNFWGIWCPPCSRQMPILNGLKQQYGNQGLEVIGLHVGDADGMQESFRNIKLYVGRLDLHYYFAVSPKVVTDEVFALSNFNGIPITLLVDRNGRIRSVYRGFSPNEHELLDRRTQQLIHETS